MRRRALLLAGGASVALAAVRSFAQASKALPYVVYVPPGTKEGFGENFNVFRATLKELGYAEGRNISIEAFWGDNKVEGFAARAASIVVRNPAVIVTASSALVAAFKKATPSIPIVFATAAWVVEQGFVASLRRPGGNITGVILHSELSAKIAEVAREAFPKMRRLAILVDDKDPIHRSQLAGFEPSAQRLGFEPLVVRIARAEDLERAFKELAERKAEAVYQSALALLASLRSQLAERALKMRLPLLSSNMQDVEAGALLSYGTLQVENYRRTAALVDKILRGAKPGDLPVEQPEHFRLAVNMRTAKAIGVTLSPAIMLRVDRVIE